MRNHLDRLVFVAASCVLAASCSGRIVDDQAAAGAPGSDDVGNLPGGDEPLEISQGRLIIHEPARGAMVASTAGPTVKVRGQILEYLDEPLVIEGVDVLVDADGNFETDVAGHPGMNVITLELGGPLGLRAQRTFFHGEFAPADAEVAGAVALAINQVGMDDGEADLDDLASIGELALAEADVVAALPASYTASAPAVGDVDVVLLEKSAGDPTIDLQPRAGGLRLSARLPDVRIRHAISFNCAVTTCRSTGTATAEAAIISADVEVHLDGAALVVEPRDVVVDLVNFHNTEDGGVAQAVQGVLEFFVTDLTARIEAELAGAVGSRLPGQLSTTLGTFSLPLAIDLPASQIRLDVTQRIDQASFSDQIGVLGLAASVRGVFEPGDPGLTAPGWFRAGAEAGGYRPEPPFAISASLDLLNQLIFAVWGQGGLAISLPGPAGLGFEVGEATIALAAPPIVQPGKAGDLWISVGDVLVSTTIDGVPAEIALAMKAEVDLQIDPDARTARIALVGEPVLWAELIVGPADLPGGLFAALIESAAPELIAKAMAGATLPIPTMPLDAVSPALAGKAFQLTPPADVVSDAPPGKITIYGRFAAE